LRELKIWVAQPMPQTFNDLLRRLCTDLVTVVNRRWHELPDPELPEAEAKAADGRNLSRARRILLVLLAIVTSVAAVAVVSVQDRFGSAATIVSTVLGTVAIALFGSTGLSVDRIKQAAETWTLINKPPK
jgi:lipopolysaccharide export LptBFGC system permease protein LptF